MAESFFLLSAALVVCGDYLSKFKRCGELVYDCRFEDRRFEDLRL
jgi:hypothetical protein